MPELPELEIVIEVLQRRVVGHTIDNVRLIGGAAIVVRDLVHLGFAEALTGVTITRVIRRGKFLVFNLASERQSARGYLALNPKLTGRLQLARLADKRMPKTHIIFTLSSGDELRYADQRTMGQLYLTSDLSRVPDYATMGPEPFDISLDEFRDRLKPYRGEIKGILTETNCIWDSNLPQFGQA